MDINNSKSTKPIYFGIAIWGEDFCKKFLENCLASLLANGNIPALPNNGHNKFLFCTTPNDWEWLKSQPLFILLSQYLTAEFMPIKMAAGDDSQNNSESMAQKFQIVTQAHSDILDRMYREKAIGSLIFPDTIYANNSLKSVFPNILKNNIKAVLACVPRLSTPSLLNSLSEQGYIQSDTPTNIPNRTLAYNALMHMNTEVLAQNWNSLYAFDFITDIWLPLDKHPSDGIVTHSFAWCPIFMDYSKLASHNIKCLENNTIDGAYLYSNFKIDDLYVVTDSDEFLMISYSPHTRLRIKEKMQHNNPRIDTIKKIAYWRKMIEMSLGGFVDPLKLELLRFPIILHSRELGKKDCQVRNKTNSIVNNILDKPSFTERLVSKFHFNRFSNKIYSLRKVNTPQQTSIIDELITGHAY